MKNYTITVNGNVYEVTVEEGFTGSSTEGSSGTGSSSGSSGWRSRRSSSYSSDAG